MCFFDKNNMTEINTIKNPKKGFIVADNSVPITPPVMLGEFVIKKTPNNKKSKPKVFFII